MTKREQLKNAINHKSTNEVVVDLGSTAGTGIAASTLTRLRKAIGLSEEPVKVFDPFQMLGALEDDFRKTLNIHVASIMPIETFFGYKNENFKLWKLPDGTAVLVGEGFVTTVDDHGNTFIYPKGDINAPPSGKMPKGGFYFDPINRQKKIIYNDLDARKDFSEDFKIISDDVLEYIEKETEHLYRNTDYGIIGDRFFACLGDAGLLTGASIRDPNGIRDLSEWLITHRLKPGYIMEVNEFQTEIALKNLELYRQAVGDKIQVVPVSGSDFGTQRGELISPDMFREFYKPFYGKINDWIHRNTSWKTYYHSCGSIIDLLDDFIDCGVDIINPVQTSAFGMEPKALKRKYGDRLVFWGGGVDTQHTLPFGTADDVRKEVLERLNVFSANSGYVFATVHNIQPKTPITNILAMFETIEFYNNKK